MERFVVTAAEPSSGEQIKTQKLKNLYVTMDLMWLNEQLYPKI